MIEAVTSLISNSQLLRSVAEQTSTTQTLTANPARVQTAAVSAPYLSPHVDYNGGNSKPIFVVRDSSTGETLKQFPSEGQIRAYQKAAQVQEQVMAQVQFQRGTGGGSSDSAEAAAMRSADVAKSSIEFKAARQAIKQQTEIHIPGAKSVKSEPVAVGGGGNAGSGGGEVSAAVDTQV